MKLRVLVEKAGQAVGPGELSPFDLPVGCLVHVELRDTSLADAPSSPVATVDATTTGGGPVIAVAELDVNVATLPSGARLSVRAHCDRSGDGRVAPGDWVTTQSYPVELSAGRDGELAVLVRPVG
jgi:uncharacterized lipoprotein YbaY